MAVSTTNAIDGPFTANGATTVFPFTFTASSASDVTVLLRDADGNDITADDYTVSLTAGGGGSVTFDDAPASGEVYVLLDPDFTQDTEFEQGGPFLARAVNATNDKAAARDQVLRRDVARSIRVPFGEDGLTLPAVASRAGMFPVFDADGGLAMSSGTGADAALRTDLALPGGSTLVALGTNTSLGAALGEVITASDSAASVATKAAAAAGAGKELQLTGSIVANPISTSAATFHARALAGVSYVTKAIDGVLWTHAGNYGRFENVFFDGAGKAGANVYCTGGQTDFINCNSQNAMQEALSSIGPVHVTNGVWECDNPDPEVPVIRMGQAGVASLYGSFIGIRTTTHGHPIYEIDTGSTVRIGGQSGGLIIDSSGFVEGCNGGHTFGWRFTGSIICNKSTSTWGGCMVADGYHVTFGSGTSAHSFGIASNLVSPTSNVNNLGNNSSDICVNRGDGTRGLGGPCYAFGASGPSAQGSGAELWIGVSQSGGAPDVANGSIGTPGYFVGEYNKGFRSRGFTSSNIYNVAVVYASGGSITIGHGTAAAQTIIGAGTGGVLALVANTTITRTTATAFLPDANGTTALGGASNRWSEVFAATGTINTSDANLKEQVGAVPDAWLDAWGDVSWQRFKMKDAVAEKGDDARWHVGLIAQEVRDAYIAHGLDATEIGLLCFDEWEAESAEEEVWQEEYTDEAGNVYPRTLLSPAKAAREAGSTWGLRYAECQAMEAAYQRRRSDALEARLAALEGA